ncbi:hypothetical protein [Butyrivibrio sp. AC2005]|uniref:hypothetical protein n=1 Tax=Butyrivibrio sp. AC2005 TaxID=1280672 RepID=UPI00040200D6|nr:hypothetical protein [Butyrivibrio sp. AC2005]
MYYKKALEKNPAYNRANEKCMEELVTIPSFANYNGDPASVRKVGSIIHYLHTWAPVLTEFAAWVLNDAREKGIRKLYFLSRDAWPVYRAAMEIVKSSDDIKTYPELRYLRVSRYALRIPEMALDDSHFLDMMFLSGIDVTMRKILRRGALDKNEIQEFTGILGYNDSLDRILSRPEILQWKEKASASKESLWPIIQKHAKKRLPKALGYLKQEGMLSDEKIAIVDSGWVGTTQRSLTRLLCYEKPGTRLYGYYFGLYEVPTDMNPKDYYAFYFSPKNRIRRKVYFSNCLFEAVSSEAAGITLGYKKDSSDSGRFHAEIVEYGSLNREYLETMQPYLEMYANAYSSYSALDNGAAISESILSKLMAKPDKWEANIYGNLFFCDDVLEEDAQTIAAKLTYEDICNLRLLRKTLIWFLSKFNVRTADIHESGWIYGSIVRCGKHVHWSLMQARLYNYLMYIRKKYN